MMKGDPRELPLHPSARRCLRSGMCCLTSACPFGIWDKKQERCEFLFFDVDNRAICGRYDEILSLSREQWEIAPAFGAGCCMPLFNELRREIRKQMIEDGEEDPDLVDLQQGVTK